MGKTKIKLSLKAVEKALLSAEWLLDFGTFSTDDPIVAQLIQYPDADDIFEEVIANLIIDRAGDFLRRVDPNECTEASNEVELRTDDGTGRVYLVINVCAEIPGIHRDTIPLSHVVMKKIGLKFKTSYECACSMDDTLRSAKHYEAILKFEDEMRETINTAKYFKLITEE